LGFLPDGEVPDPRFLLTPITLAPSKTGHVSHVSRISPVSGVSVCLHWSARSTRAGEQFGAPGPAGPVWPPTGITPSPPKTDHGHQFSRIGREYRPRHIDNAETPRLGPSGRRWPRRLTPITPEPAKRDHVSHVSRISPVSAVSRWSGPPVKECRAGGDARGAGWTSFLPTPVRK
jgi:hypothetical protein